MSHIKQNFYTDFKQNLIFVGRYVIGTCTVDRGERREYRPIPVHLESYCSNSVDLVALTGCDVKLCVCVCLFRLSWIAESCYLTELPGIHQLNKAVSSFTQQEKNDKKMDPAQLAW